MSQSIWGATHRTASSTIRIPVDTSSSSTPGYVSGLDIVDLTLSSQTGNSGKFLTTDGTNASWSTITESNLTISDNTTNDATASAHGFLPKLSNSSDEFLDGTGNYSNIIECIAVSPVDEVSDLEVGTSLITFRMPYAFTITSLKASLSEAATGANVEVDINVNSSSILDVVLSIDDGETTSVTATTPYELNTTELSDDDEVTIDIDQVGSLIPGAGLKIYMLGYKNN